MTVSACAKNIDGTVGIVECNNDNSNLSKLRTFKKKLDNHLPGPDISKVKEFHTAISADKNGVIKLENGVNLSFSGMQCNHVDLKKYLDAFLVNDKDARLVYLPSGYKENNIEFAYIWGLFPHVNINQMKKYQNSYGNPTHETALFSDWCKPIEQANHNYHNRFLAINEYIKSL